MKKRGILDFPTHDCLLGFDAEWTKNYKIKNGNIPFCFSIVSVSKQEMSLNNLRSGNVKFKYIQFYCDHREDARNLVALGNSFADMILSSLDTSILCGHQMSSDFSTLYNYGKAVEVDDLYGIDQLYKMWNFRKFNERVQVFDTRYDVIRSFMGKSRRLVDVCRDFNIDVTQPELRNTSMTKLQNSFYDSGDEDIYERIAVMNLRHSFCALVLYWLNKIIKDDEDLIHFNINKSIYGSLNKDFNWVRSNDFSKLL
ncbi:MAG: hypothetical protein IKP82_04275 [Oscillospiraceae bacterium]|nr:hypothetical protein [Oscillospiraceae bacterium]